MTAVIYFGIFNDYYVPITRFCCKTGMVSSTHYFKITPM